MKWLLTLAVPNGGIVLDSFAGSGTTGVAAAELGISALLIERGEEYFPILCARVQKAVEDAKV